MAIIFIFILGLITFKTPLGKKIRDRISSRPVETIADKETKSGETEIDIISPNKEIDAEIIPEEIVRSIKAGEGIAVTAGQFPTVSNTGVLSLGGKTGTVYIDENGLKFDNQKLYNSDKGSSQNIIKTIKVDGHVDIEADTNHTELYLVAGTGITIDTNNTEKKISFNSKAGWIDDGTVVRLADATDLLKINSVTYSFPSSQGSVSSILQNDGTGGLAWATLGAASITADSLDFTEFKDAMTLDAATDVALASHNFTFSGSGNVGIGTTSPGYTLDVNGDARFNTITTTAQPSYMFIGSGGPNLAFGWADSSTYHRIRTAGGDNGNIVWELVNPASHYLAIGADFQVTQGATIGYPVATARPNNGLAVSGNVGIGTTSPQAKLDVTNGNIYLSTDGSYIKTWNGTIDNGLGGASGSKLQFNGNTTTLAGNTILTLASGASSGNDTVFKGGSNEWMRILGDSGRVGIGTTAPGALLHLANSTPIIEMQDTAQGTDLGLMRIVNNSQTLIFGAENDARNSFTNALGIRRNGGITVGNGYVVNYGAPANGAIIEGNVGIGTTSPGSKLHINGGYLTVTGNGVSNSAYLDTDANGAYLQSSASTDLRLMAHTVEGLRIKASSGNVGIGTTAPSTKLHVVGDARITGALYDSSNSAGSSGMILTSTGTGTTWATVATTLDSSYFKQNGNSFGGLATLGTNDSYGLALETGGSERLRIDTSGNVGIGTTAPGAKLELYANTNNSIVELLRLRQDGAGAGAGGKLSFQRSDGEHGYIQNQYVDATLGYSTQLGGDSVILQSAGADRLTVANSGNVGIGTTNPLSKLHIKATGTLYRAGLNFEDDTSSNIYAHIYLADGTNGTANDALYFDGPNNDFNFRSGPSTEQKLNIGASVGVTGGYRKGLQLKSTTGSYGNWYIGDGTNGTMTDEVYFDTINTAAHFRSDSTEVMYMSLTGNLGIGTQAPSTKLHVVGNGTYAATFMSGNVGIGTTSPNEKLEVNGNIRLPATSSIVFGGTYGTGTLSFLNGATTLATLSSTTGLTSSLNFKAGYGIVSNPAYGFSDESSVGIYKPSSNTLGFATSNLDRMTITSGGEVGIGTTAPGAKLEVNGIAKVSSGYYLSTPEIRLGGYSYSRVGYNDGDGSPYIGYNTVYDASDSRLEYDSLGTLSAINTQSGGLKFYTGTSQVAGTAAVERMILDTSGNLGVGTASPNARLTVKGAGATSQDFFHIEDSAGTRMLEFISNANGDGLLAIKDTSGATDISLNTNGDSYFTGGNVGIGTTSPSQLFVVGNNNQFTVTTAGQVISSQLTADGLRLLGSSALNTIYNAGQAINMTTSGFDISLGTAISAQNLIVKATTGNVGIGTTAPSQKLDVSGSVRINGAANGLYMDRSDGTTAQVLGFNSGTHLVLGGIGGGSVLFNWSGGSQASLSSAGGFVAHTLAADENKISLSGTTTTGTPDNRYGFLAPYNGTDNLYAYSRGTMSFNVNGASSLTEAMRINSSGNVGIGTTAPSTKLHVVGDARITGALYDSSNSAGSSGMILTSTGTGTTWATVATTLDSSYFKQNGNSFGGLATLGTNDSYGLALETGGSERLRIDTSGNVGIGTTAPSYLLDVNGTARVTSLGVGVTPSGVSGRIDATVLRDTNNNWIDMTDTTSIRFYTGSNSRMSINNSGVVTIGDSINNVNLQTSGGNVGIGTTAPGQLLQVSGASGSAIGIKTPWAGGAYGQLRFETGTGESSIRSYLPGDSTNGLQFYTYGSGSETAKLTILGSGNVGIGTTGPNNLLTLDSSGSMDKGIHIVSGATAIGSLETISVGGTLSLGLDGGSGRPLALNSQVSSNVLLATGGGNVGIGTTAPTNSLHLYSSNGGLNIQTSGSVNPRVGFYNSAGTIKAVTGYNVAGDYAYSGYGGNANLTINSGGNVGIGTTSPEAKLDINGNSIIGRVPTAGGGAFAEIFDNTGSSGMFLQQRGTSATGFGSVTNISELVTFNTGGLAIYNTAAKPILFGTTSAERMRIDASGNVGIGTTAPGQLLQVSGASGSAIGIKTPWSGGAYGQLRFETGTGESSIRSYLPGDSTNGLQFYTYGSGSETAKLTILGSGNVGIGTTSPASKLFVGSGTLAGGSLAGLNVALGTDSYIAASDGTKTTFLGADSGSAMVGTLTNHNLYLRTNNTNVMTLTTAGNVGIGTTSPLYSLHIAKAGSVSGLIQDTSGGAANIRLAAGTITSDQAAADWILQTIGSDGRFRIFNQSPTSTGEKLTLLQSGNVGIGTTAPGYKLDIQGSSSPTAHLFALTNTVTQSTSEEHSVGLLLGAANSCRTTYAKIAGTESGLDGYGGLSFYTDSGNCITQAYSERMRITSAGNVGIGTTSPSSLLHVQGATSNRYMKFADGSFGSGVLSLSSDSTGHSAGVALINTATNGRSFRVASYADGTNNGSLRFYDNTAGLDRLTIDYSGNVGIGTTAPGYKLDVNGNTRSTVLFDYDNTNYYVDPSGGTGYSAIFAGNVGIGTTAPGAKLEVAGSLNSSNSSIRITNTDTNSYVTLGSGIPAISNSGFNLSLDGSSRLVVSSGGNVGIGTTSPGTLLDVNGTVRTNSYLQAGTGNIVLNSGISTALGNSGTYGTLDAANWGTGSQALVLQSLSGGNVGIGTTSPSQKLHVEGDAYYNGQINFNTSSSQGLKWDNAYLRFGGQDDGVQVHPYSSAYTAFSIKGASGQTAPLMRWMDSSGVNLGVIDGSGSIGIGTTAPGAMLQVNQGGTNSDAVKTIGSFIYNGLGAPDTNDTTLLISGYANSANGRLLDVQHSDTSRNGTGTSAFVVRQDGNVGIGTTAPVVKLDVRGAIFSSNLGGGLYLSDSNIPLCNSGPCYGIGLSSLDLGGGANSTVQVAGYYGLNFSTANNNRLSITSSGNVGIGTTAPSAALDVNGVVEIGDGSASIPSLSFGSDTDTGIYKLATNAIGFATAGTARWFIDTNGMFTGSGTSQILNTAGSLGDPSYSFSGDEDTGLYSPTGNVLGLQTAGSERLRIDSAGNVGIGTTAPTAQLEIGTPSNGHYIQINPSGGAYGIRNIYSSESNPRWQIGTDQIGSGLSALTFNNIGAYTTAANGVGIGIAGTRELGFYTSNATALTERMRINASGNVGIGTTNPGAKLDVNGGVRISNGSTYGSLTTGAATGLLLGVAADVAFAGFGDNVVLASRSNDILFGTNNLERARITSAGNVGIGTTAPGALLDLSSPATTTNVLNLTANSLTTGKGINLTSTSTGLTSGNLFNAYWNPGSSTTATGDLFKIDIGANALVSGNLFGLYNNGSALFTVGTSKITSALPHEFTAAGDVSFASDISLTNQTSNNISSLGPLTITSGESYENLDLTLKAYGTGAVIVDQSSLSLNTGENLILDSDDSSNSYFQHNNASNYLSVFTDGTEVARFMSDGSVDANTTFDANQFDIAEYYPTTDSAVEAGDVVSLSKSDKKIEELSAYLVNKVDSKTTDKVLGVVSTKPGFSMGGGSFRSQFCAKVTDGNNGEESAREELIKSHLRDVAKSVIEKSLDPSLIAQDDKSASAKATADESAVLKSVDEDVLQKKVDELYEKYKKGEKDILDEAQLSTVEDKIATCKSIKQVPIALAGRVPVKVDLTAGEIKTGDLLTASPYETGKAMKATGAGWVLGRALEDAKNGDKTVMVYVFISWYDPAQNGSVAGISTSKPLDLSASVLDGNLTATGKILANEMAVTDHLTVGLLQLNAAENSINTVAAPLLLQNTEGAGEIQAFGGKLVMTVTGGIVSQDMITAKTVAAEQYAVLGASENASIGEGTIPAGETEVTINNSRMKASSKIFVTATSSTAGKELIVKEKKDGSFTVVIETAAAADITFDYWIVGVMK